MSHGEAFLAMLGSRFDAPGLCLLDEPESALSFSFCLGLLGLLADLSAHGSQVLCATHSPLLASLPGATVLELDSDGFAPVAWDDLQLVAHWKAYLAEPGRYLRHGLPDDRGT